MKNIFRKTVQKVRETAAKVSHIVKENQELILSGVALAAVGASLIGIIRDARKTPSADVDWLNNDAAALNTEVALTAFEHVQEAFKTALKNGDIDDENRLKISPDIVTRDDADLLSDLRLYNDASGMLNISYTPDRKDWNTYYMGRRESEKQVPNPKTDKEVFGPIGYDADSLVKTFQHVYDAFKAGYEASEESPCVAVNLGEHGVTPFDADMLDLLGLRKKGERLVKLFYWSEDENAVFGTRS